MLGREQGISVAYKVGVLMSLSSGLAKCHKQVASLSLNKYTSMADISEAYTKKLPRQCISARAKECYPFESLSDL